MAARVYEIELLLKSLSLENYVARLSLQREHATLSRMLEGMS